MKKYNLNSRFLVFIFSLFSQILLSSCSEEKREQVWILLIDYTVYDSPDMYSQLKRFKEHLENRMKDYAKFKEIRKTKILRMAVDDRGANKIELCLDIPEFQGLKNKKIDNSMKDLEACLKNIEKEIAHRPHTEFKKTLYMEALGRALEEIQKYDRDKSRIIIFGDLAIVDDECFLEEKRCECAKFNKLNKLKEKINTYKKSNPDFYIEYNRVNIPKEESCQEKRREIWKALLGPAGKGI